MALWYLLPAKCVSFAFQAFLSCKHQLEAKMAKRAVSWLLKVGAAARNAFLCNEEIARGLCMGRQKGPCPVKDRASDQQRYPNLPPPPSIRRNLFVAADCCDAHLGY